jgi:hypothetical protein
MGTLVFVDSYSLIRWEEELDVGPAAMIVTGRWVESDIPEMSEIDGITKAASLQGDFFNIESFYKLLNWNTGLEGISYNSDFIEKFPTIFVLVEGRYPENDGEVAVSLKGADLLKTHVGDEVNYSLDFTVSSSAATVVGIYEHAERDSGAIWMYIKGDIMVDESVFFDYWFSLVYVDIDRSQLSAHDPDGTLSYLQNIAEEIRHLDGTYKFTGNSRYAVFNPIANGIENYEAYLTDLRFTQVFRAGGLILLGLSGMFLAVSHVMKERDFENNMLVARGASKRRVKLMTSVEVISTSLIALPLGLLFGILISRMGMCATGFFQFDFSILFSQPLLISIEALVYTLVIGFGAPILFFLTHQEKKTQVEETTIKTSRLARITESLSFISGDVVILIFSSLLLVTLNLGGTSVAANPFFSAIISILPFAVFFSLTSVALKGLRRFTPLISRGFGRVFGRIPSSVGIRRIGKETSSSIILVIVLVLAMSLSWNYAINDATLPYTRLNQTRFAIGGDIAFHLDSSYSDSWDEFMDNATAFDSSTQGSLLSIVPLSLSSGTEGAYDFVSIIPEEYSQVGYDSLGNPLNDSGLTEYLTQLQVTESGAVITQDIAQTYGLSAGGTLRAFWQNRTTLETLEFSIVGVVDAIPDTLTFSRGYSPYPGFEWTYSVGAGKVWVNHDFVETLISSLTEIEHVYCLRIGENTNSSQLVDQLLELGSGTVIKNSEWVSASLEVERYLAQESYRLDRSADSLFTILSVLTIFGTFAIYSTEGLNARRREIALLRSLGADQSMIIRTQVVEMVVLYMMSIILLLMFTPVLAVNTLLSAVRVYGGVAYVYPSAVTMLYPWLLMLTILAFFVLCVAVFITVIASLGAKISLSETLNYTWTEAGPYVEEI